MDFFRRISFGIPGFPSSTKPAQTQPDKAPVKSAFKRRLDATTPLTPGTKTRRWLKSTSKEPDDFEGETLIEGEKPRKKPRSPVTPKSQSKPQGRAPRAGKRRKQNNGSFHYNENIDDAGADGDFEGETLLTRLDGDEMSPRKHELDKQAMPPPPQPQTSASSGEPYIPDTQTIVRDLRHSVVRAESSVSSDERALARNRIGPNNRMEVSPKHDYEASQRHAEARTLPQGGEFWNEVESDLFHRLSMRGFEPLIPDHWSVDFKTLPGQLFSLDGQKPLITPFATNEFRAKHFLRLLFDIASRVRDRSLMGLPVEDRIKRPVLKYLDWALLDAGVHITQRPRVIPTHAVVTKRAGETTAALIERMQRRLCRLATRYQEAHRLPASIESDASSQIGPNEDLAAQYEHGRMPTLIGIMIASSVVAFLTLDSRCPLDTDEHELPSSPSPSPKTDPTLPTSSLNIIAKFDFSTHEGYDVWDGFAIAIAVMRIRRTMVELGAVAESKGEDGLGGVWEFCGGGGGGRGMRE